MDKQENVKLAVVIPCLNEEEGLNYTIDRLKEVLASLVVDGVVTQDSFIYLVDDGSTDKTWGIIQAAHNVAPDKVKGLKLTSNFGNQNAILAGLRNVRHYKPDCVITIDADLQQDETKIKDFIEEYKKGADVVFGIRNDRKADNFFKKTSAKMFYKFMEQMGVYLIPNHSEYRLMSSNALEMFYMYNEKNIFIRGIFANMGLKSAEVPFDVKERKYGKSKFNLYSLMRLASWGITSFSVRPLRLIFHIGLIIAFISFLLGIVCIWNLYVPTEYEVLDSFKIELFEVYETFASGLQILAIGVIGEYVGQILQEIKGRPNYLIDKKLD